MNGLSPFHGVDSSGFTISMWVKFDSITTTYKRIMKTAADVGGQSNYVYIQFQVVHLEQQQEDSLVKRLQQEHGIIYISMLDLIL